MPTSAILPSEVPPTDNACPAWRNRMKVLTAAALVAGIGFATAIEPDFRPDASVVSEVAGSLISGIILGSNVWQSVPVAADVESRMMASGHATPLADGYWAVAE
jgi:hypothetical protein